MLQRLKKRRDFLAAAKGKRLARRAFLLEFRRREDDGPPRFGFTVSKRTAKKAVERNRIRRRLKEAVRLLPSGHAESGCDYVLVGRPSGMTEPFSRLSADLAQALRQARTAAAPPARSERQSSTR